MKKIYIKAPTDEEESGVHHSRAVQHGGHQDVVTRAIHKRDMSEHNRTIITRGPPAASLASDQKQWKLCSNNRLQRTGLVWSFLWCQECLWGTRPECCCRMTGNTRASGSWGRPVYTPDTKTIKSAFLPQILTKNWNWQKDSSFY